MAGVVVTIPMEFLNVVLFNIMSPIVREISAVEEKNTTLRRLAKEAAMMIKKRLDNEQYTKLLSRIQQNLDIKKAERRKIRTQQVIFYISYIFIIFYKMYNKNMIYNII